MNKLREEGGYTLIIALLLIVLFLGMSAVFMQASLSHATQEQTVDQGNLAVAAAEMGVEKYSKEAENAFAKTYAKVNASALLKKKALEAEVKKYPNHVDLNTTCLKANKPVMQDWIQCNIDKYAEELRTEFYNEMQTQLSLINKDEVAVSDTLSHELANISLLPMTATDKSIKVKMDVTGEKSEPNQVPSATKTVLRSKTLPTELNFPEVPFFNENAISEVEVKWGEPIAEVTNFFSQLVEKPLAACPPEANITKDMPPCKYEGVVPESYLKALRDANVDGSFYIKVDEFLKQLNNDKGYNIPLLSGSGAVGDNTNINQLSNTTLYYKGALDFQNTTVNSVNNFLVAEMITFHNNQNLFNNTFIIIGSVPKRQFIASKVTINDGSKLCVNLDGITTSTPSPFTSIDVSEKNGESNANLSVRGTGKIYLYSKDAIPTTLPSDSKVVYFKDPAKFLETCGVAVNYNVEGIEIFGLPLPISDMEWDVDMDVEY